MKILMIAPQPFFTVRGTPLAIRELVGVFLRTGHSVDVLTFHLGEDVPGLRIYRNKIFSKVIKSIPPGFSVKKFLLDIVLLPKALWLILQNRYDVVHCVEESSFLISWFRCIRPSLFIYDMDSDIPKQLKESGKIKNWFILRLIKEIEKIAIRRADAIVTICPVFTNKIKRIYPNKIVFQIEDVSVVDKIPWAERKDHEKRILYTGNFEKYQGVELLIEAFKKTVRELPSVILIIVGGEDEEVGIYKKRYDDKQIIFTGKKPLSEIPNFLQMVDILVSPRLKGDNTPFKIYSYLATGKPILATNIISHTQVLTNEKDSLLVEPTIEAIAEGLKRLIKDEDLAHRLGIGARKLFSENYTRVCFDGKVKNYINFLEENIWKKK